LDYEQREKRPRQPRVDWQDVARLLAVRSEMADLREDLLAVRYQSESALVALKAGDAEAAERHLHEAQRAIEAAVPRTRLPEKVFLHRLPRSRAEKIFKGVVGEGG
jgi:HSP20 family molecular chaperone IbpA